MVISNVSGEPPTMTFHDDCLRKSPETTDWLDDNDQQFWFNQFKSPDANGLKFKGFQDLLNYTIYRYLESFPEDNKSLDSSIDNDCKFTHQQEMQLFKVFDEKNDHILDFEEFSSMCQRWISRVFKPSCALVIVDVQNDFIDGSLALINGSAKQDGAEVIPVINNLLETNIFKTVVYTQDWHPVDHIGFHANLHLRKYSIKDRMMDKPGNFPSDVETLPGSCEPLKYKKMNPDAKVFDTVLFEDGRIEQKLWPIHCVQNSWGAQLHPKLKIVSNAVYIQKGTMSHVDAYSAFWDNMKLNETGLRQELLSRKISDVYFCGLALDYCVAASAIDSAKAGFLTYVIEDACRGIDTSDIERCKREIAEHGALILDSSIVSRLTCNGNKDSDDTETHSEFTWQGKSKELLSRNVMKSICYRRAIS